MSSFDTTCHYADYKSGLYLMQSVIVHFIDLTYFSCNVSYNSSCKGQHGQYGSSRFRSCNALFLNLDNYRRPKFTKGWDRLESVAAFYYQLHSREIIHWTVSVCLSICGHSVSRVCSKTSWYNDTWNTVQSLCVFVCQ